MGRFGGVVLEGAQRAQKKRSEIASLFFVPKTGLEPASLSALAPETSASTNFATWATHLFAELVCKYTNVFRYHANFRCIFYIRATHRLYKSTITQQFTPL